MKYNFTKILTGILLAVFVTAFGVSSAFADSTPGWQTNGSVAATGEIIDCPTCQGEVFISIPAGTGHNAGSGVNGQAETQKYCNGQPKQVERQRSANITGAATNHGTGGQSQQTVIAGQNKWQCDGTFLFTKFWVDKLKSIDNVFIAPVGAIVWIISFFFSIVADFATQLTNYSMQHAFSFFSDIDVKNFIFNFWYSFAMLVFSFYLVIVAVSAFQLMLGIDADHMSIKKLLPRIFGSVVITGFSFVFFLVMLDVGNILTSVIYKTFGESNITVNNAASIISKMILPQGISNLSGAIKALPTNAMTFLSGATITLFAGLLLLAFVSLSFVLVKRTIILVISGILGPFAGLAYAIPGAESYTGKWAKTVAHHAILPAILAFFIGVAIQGGRQIQVFAEKLGSGNFELFAIADFPNGGIHLADLAVVMWVVSCVYFGATHAIKTEYTEDAIGVAKGVGEKVKGFFQPALSKTAIFAGVGGAATGAFGGTAAAVTWGAGGYKLAGMGYNATEQKIMEIGKKRLTGYSKDALDKTPLVNKVAKWFKASEEVYEKKEAIKDDNRKMATSTVAAQILRQQASRASGDDAKKLNSMADSHLMKIRNEDFSETVKKNEHLTGYDMQNQLDSKINLLEDILKNKDPAETTTAINENSGLLRAGYKILSDNGQLQDWKSKHPEVTKEDWKRLEAHLFLTPSQGLRYDELLAEKIANPAVATSVEYVELENAIHTASGNYVTKDFEMMKKNGERAMMRKLDQAGKTEGNDTAVAGILVEELDRAQRDPKLLSSHDRGAMLAVVDRLPKMSPKVLPSEMQKLLAQLSAPEYLNHIVRIQNGYALDQPLVDPKDIEIIDNKRKELVKMFHFAVDNKDLLMRENKEKDGALMSVPELLNGEFDNQGDFQIYARNRVADENKFLDNLMSQFTRVKEAELGEVKPEVLKAFTANIVRYKDEILADRQQRGWEKTLRSMLKRIENADFVGGADQKIVIGNTLRQLFPNGWDNPI